MTENTTEQHTTPRRRWRWLAALLTLLILAGALLLDLRFRGLAWQFFWSQTGEESIVGQLRGMVELGGNLIRVQPQVDVYAPIDHADVIPFGINTFLEQEAEVPKIREQLRMISAAGFTFLRQEFPWEEIEVDGRGLFTDSRNDMDGDGTPDTRDAWEKFDRIVDLSEEYGLQLQVRLSNPPTWAQASAEAGDFAPPVAYQDYVNYAVAVAERYRGRVRYYQIWNEPNIFPEWGDNFANPAEYTDLLCRTYDALKAVDPEIVVISAAIAPTISLDGYFGYQDLVYLQSMYDNGAGDCFDVLAAQGYGLFSGPTDRRMRATTTNYARHVYYRDIMVKNGDSHKAIWLSEVAWNPVLDAFRPPEEIADYDRYGTVTNDQAARYTPIAYQRALEEWPWIGAINYWFFTRPTIEDSDHSSYYFRMVEADYTPEHGTFTPLPIYESMSAYIAETSNLPTLYRGTHQAESWEVTAEDGVLVAAADAQFGDVMQAQTVYFSAEGTTVQIRIQTDAPIRVVQDGTFDLTPIPANLPSSGWRIITLDSSLLSEDHLYILEGEAPFLLDSITVRDDSLLTISIGVGIVLLLVIGGGILFMMRRLGEPLL